MLKSIKKSVKKTKKTVAGALTSKKTRAAEAAIPAVRVNTLVARTGCSEKEARAMIAEAVERLDITPGLYIKYHFYDVPKKSQKSWAKRVALIEKRHKRQERTRRVQAVRRVALGTGTSYEASLATMRRVKKEYGVPFTEYANQKYYLFPEAVYAELHEKALREEALKTKKAKENQIKRTRSALRCSRKSALAVMKDAKERLGISATLYGQYRFFSVPQKEQPKKYLDMLKAEAKRERDLFKLQQQRISRIATRTGWTKAEAEQAMLDAQEHFGISNADYLISKLYRLPVNEQEARYKEVLEERSEAVKQEAKDCVQAIMRYRNCEEEEAQAELDEARRRLGITARTYRRYHFYEMNKAEQSHRYQEVLAQLKERTNTQISDNEGFLERIAEASGWDLDTTRKKVVAAEERCGASWKDFFAYKFWDIDEKEQPSYFTAGMQRALSDRFDVLENRDRFVNKEMFLESFSNYLGRKWAVSTHLSLEGFKEKFSGCEKIIYKPSNNGNSGSGIELYDLSEGMDAAFEQISQLPRGILEEYIVQHDVLNDLYPDSVNTLRIASVCWDDEETGEKPMEIAYATLRIGSGRSYVDNFTTGGMVASIDLATGKVITDAVNIDGKRFEKHPDTGAVVKGFEVPYFKESLELVKKAGASINGYIGWDVAITNKGPILIEGNIDPGNRLLQMPFVPEKRGAAPVMEKYLAMTDFRVGTEADINYELPTFELFNKMKMAEEEYGISEEEFMKEKYYLLDARKLIRLMTSDGTRARVDYISSRFNAPAGEVYQKGLDINSEYSIPFYYYTANDLYPETSSAVFKQHRAKMMQARKDRVRELADITGWDLPTVRHFVSDIYKRFGVDIVFIKDHELFKRTDEEIEEIIAEDKQDTRDRLEKIMRETGWTDYEYERSRVECRYRYGIFSLVTYDNHECWRTPYEVLDTYGNPKDSLALGAKYNTIPTDILDDKTLFDQTFKDFLGRKFWINRDTTIEEFEEFIDGLDVVFCKPINLLGGHGSYRYTLTDNVQEMYDYFMNEAKMLIEEVPKQHHLMNEIYDNCIDSVRVTTLLDGDEFHAFACWVKFGGKGSVVDGRVDGGCFAAVDEKTGVVITKALDKYNQRHANHFDTGAKILGFQIPYWDEVLALVEKALRYIDGINFVGWDIAITENGPVIIEGNSKPALGDYQLLFEETKEGKKWQYEQFL